MMNSEEIKFLVYAAEEGGYWAEAADHGIVTQGETLDELRAMIEDAINGYFFDEPLRPRTFAMVFQTEAVTSV